MKINSGAKKVTSIGAVAGAIIAAIFAVEDGHVNDPKDPGGETNHGITIAVARSDGYTGAMKDLPKERAEQIYIKNYIQKPGFEPMLLISPAISHKLIDAGVNVGTARPVRWFQLALNAVHRDGKDYPQIYVDGKFGSSTLNAYQSLQQVRGRVKACELMLKMLDTQQTNHYMELTHLKVFTVGWIDNRIGNVPLSQCQQDK